MPNNGSSYDALDRWKIVESEVRRTQAFRRLRQIKMWTFQDAREFVDAGVWEEDKNSMFHAMIDDAESQGAVSPYVGIKNFETLLRTAVDVSFHVVDHAGGLTGLGSMVFEPQEDVHTWRLYDRNAPSILVANLLERGNFYRDNGIPGTGKTNLACVISEEFVKEPNHIAIGNIRMLKSDPRFIYVRTVKELFRTVAYLPAGMVWLFTQDEGGLTYNKPDQATRRVKKMDRLMRCVRKLYGSYGLVEQREDSVPNIIMEFAKNIFYVEAKGVVSIEMKGPVLAFRDTVKNFPKTSLPFDTDDIAMFDVEDIDIDQALASVSGAGDRWPEMEPPEAAKRALREFLEQEHIAAGPKKCSMPECDNPVTAEDKRVRYCEKHRRVHDLGTHIVGRPREPKAVIEGNPSNVSEFLS